MSYQFLVFSFLLFACSGCASKKDEVGPIPTRNWNSYIQCFYDIKDISVLERVNFSVDENDLVIHTQNLDNIADETNAGKTYRIKDGIVLVVELRSELISHSLISGKYQTRYEALIDELGDKSFNKSFPIDIHPPIALTGMLREVKIIVNENYSTAFPAGTDISKLFSIYYEHPYAVVQNNYQSPQGTYRFDSTYSTLPEAVYRDNLSTVDLSSKRALGNYFNFVLNSPPDKAGRYTFTINIRTAESDVLSIKTASIPIAL